MQRHDFYQWDSYFSRFRRTSADLADLPDEQLFDTMRGYLLRNELWADHDAAVAEYEWMRVGRPYFKVWPGMAAALSYTQMDIPGRLLELPFPAFTIRLPKDRNPLIEDAAVAWPLKSLLITKSQRRISSKIWAGEKWCFTAHYVFDDPTILQQDHVGYYFNLPICEEESLEKSFSRAADVPEPSGDDSYTPSVAFCRRIMRLCVAICFFGIDRHELVMPDLPRKVEERLRREGAGRQELLNEAKRTRRDLIDLRMLGWRVGSELQDEIDLPSPRVRYVGEDEASPVDTGCELRYRQLRRGHMRLQPVGPRGNPNYELILVRPTIVRPDLPWSPWASGYRLRDTNLARVKRAKDNEGAA